MDTLSYKTISANKATVNKSWVVIDANNEVLGRLSAVVAMVLRGKHKADFTPHVDCGDNVIILNAEKIHLTGNKWNDKKYIRYTGYPGGQKKTPVLELLKKNPIKIIENSVKGMLPKNKLGRAIFKNLFIYVGNEHPHQAQKPKEIKLDTIK